MCETVIERDACQPKTIHAMRHVAALWRQREGENRGRDGGSVLHDSRCVVTRRSWRKERWRWGWWETGSFSPRWLCSYWGTFPPITAGHIMHSEAIRSVISWWSLQDILTCTVLKEGVNLSRQTKPNLTATLHVCRGSVGFKDEFKTSSRRRNLC